MPAFMIIYSYIYLHIFHPMCTRSLKTLIVYIVFFSSLPLFFQIYFFRFLVFARDYVARGTLRISLLFSLSLGFFVLTVPTSTLFLHFKLDRYTHIYIYIYSDIYIYMFGHRREKEQRNEKEWLKQTTFLFFLFSSMHCLLNNYPFPLSLSLVSDVYRR